MVKTMVSCNFPLNQSIDDDDDDDDDDDGPVEPHAYRCIAQLKTGMSPGVPGIP